MYCFRCGKKLPPRALRCPSCDTPQKRRQRYRKRMILGLFIFLAGAVAGSIFDTIFFRGKAWEHSFMGALGNDTASDTVLTDQEFEVAQPLSVDDTIYKLEEDLPPVRTDVVHYQEPEQEEPVKQFEEYAEPTQLPTEVSETPQQHEQDDLTEDLVERVPSEEAETNARHVFSEYKLLEDGDGSNFHAFVSKDMTEMVFASNRLLIRGEPTFQCFIKSPLEDDEPHRAFAWQGNVWTPELTFDSKHIVFSSDSVNEEHIFVYCRETTDVNRITSGGTKNMMPSVSPDGKRVAYVSNTAGSNHIWIANIDGSNHVQATHTSHDDREPRWTQDGQTIFFTRIHEPFVRSDIMRLNLTTDQPPEPVIENSGRNWLAALSPCKTTLAFVRSRTEVGGANTIYIKDMNSKDIAKIAPLGNTEYFRPTWLSDSSGFTFHAHTGNNRSIYLALFSMEQ